MPIRRPAAFIPTLVLLLPVVGACVSPGEAAVEATVADSAGIALVTSPGTDRPLAWTLTEVFRIGGADEGPGSFTAAHQSFVGTDGEGRVYVLDGQAFRVEVFDRSGAPVRFQGARGGGPGEFQMPGFLAVLPSGESAVFDYGKRALVRWDRDGTLLPEVRFDGFFPSSPTWLSGDTLIYVHDHYGEQDRRTALRFVIAGDTTEIPGIQSATSGMVMFSCVGLNLPPLFAPRLVHATNGRVTALSAQVPYRVDLFEGTRLARSLRRQVPDEATTERHVERLYPEGMKVGFGDGRECVVPAAELLEKQGAAPLVPRIRAVALGPAGRIWVQRYTFSDEPPAVDVFDAEGRYLGTLAGRPLPLGFIGDDMVLFPDEDTDSGITQVVAYRITT